MCAQAFSKCSLRGKFQSNLSSEVSAFEVLVADVACEYVESGNECFQIVPARV
jgi:hypothetical protein